MDKLRKVNEEVRREKSIKGNRGEEGDETLERFASGPESEEAHIAGESENAHQDQELVGTHIRAKSVHTQ